MTSEVLSTCDIVVVGAGITGLCTAFELRQRGYDVVVVEQRFPAFGASGRNPGCLWVQTRRAGVEVAMARRANTKYVDYVAELGDVFEYRNLGGLFFFENEDQGRILETYVRDRTSAGIAVELLTRADAEKHTPVLPETAIGAVFCPEDSQIDAQLFVRALAGAAVKRGVRIFENTAVLSTVHNGNGPEGIRTVRGEIRSSGVIWATGAWTRNLKGEGVDLPVTTARMGQVVTQPMDQRPSAILHGPRGVTQCPALTDLHDFDSDVFAQPRSSSTPHGQFDYDDSLAQDRAGSLVIGGGIDGYGSLNPHISMASTETMISTTMQRYPAHGQVGVTGLWAGLLSGTPDQLPIVDVVGDSYVNTGHGWGVASGPVSAEVLAKLIAGEESEFAQALSAKRPTLSAPSAT